MTTRRDDGADEPRIPKSDIRVRRAKDALLGTGMLDKQEAAFYAWVAINAAIETEPTPTAEETR